MEIEKTKKTKRPEQPKTRYTFMRLKDVTLATGISVTMIYSLIREGKFPRQVVLFGKTVAWRSDEVQAWMDERYVNEGRC